MRPIFDMYDVFLVVEMIKLVKVQISFSLKSHEKKATL